MDYKLTIQLLITNSEFKASMQKIFAQNDLAFNNSNSIEAFVKESMSETPEIFIIQDDCGGTLKLLDVIKDLRILFGAYPTILVIGKQITKKYLSALLTEGADYYINYPFDQMIIEDFIHKRTFNKLCRPFLYHHVPSGGIKIDIVLDIYLTEINAFGVCFKSKSLIANGTKISLDLSESIDIPSFVVDVKILSSEGHNDYFHYECCYEYISRDLTKRLIFKLKNDVS